MNKIIELASIRNNLYNNLYNNDVQEAIEAIKINLIHKEDDIYQFLLEMIILAEKEIKDKNYINASYDFGLIHNFPEDDSAEWNEIYFYKFDFVGYYDYLIEINDIKKLKKVLSLINRFLIKE